MNLHTADIEHGLTLLHWVAECGYDEVVKLLLEPEDLIPINSINSGIIQGFFSLVADHSSVSELAFRRPFAQSAFH